MSRRVASVARFLAPVASFAVAAALLAAPGSSQAAGLGEQAEALASKVAGAVFTSELKTSAAVKAGKEGAVELVVDVTDGKYHINEAYPIKFKASKAPNGLAYSKEIVMKDDFKLEKKKATANVKFTAAAAGKHKVSGVLSIGVCSDEDGKCLMEKIELDVEVDVAK